MAKAKLGGWRWYVGCDVDDGEMLDCGSREQALKDGRRIYSKGESFYLVEARMRIADEKAMESGRLETAQFEESRNGEWVRV
jgi:hypothetical protein